MAIFLDKPLKVRYTICIYLSFN